MLEITIGKRGCRDKDVLRHVQSAMSVNNPCEAHGVYFLPRKCIMNPTAAAAGWGIRFASADDFLNSKGMNRMFENLRKFDFLLVNEKRATCCSKALS